jgi:hypothetical protein
MENSLQSLAIKTLQDIVVAINIFNLELKKLVTAAAGGSATARTQRLVTASPIVVSPSDQIVNCNIPVAAFCTLPVSSTRIGAALTFKDLGQATAHHITFTPAGIETIDGGASYVIANNYGWVTFVPFNDGTNVGWMVQ